MHVVYAQEKAPSVITKSIFLAGPSPRSSEHPNWRIEALRLLEEAHFDGVVFVPLPREENWSYNYDDQVEWETKYLNMADVIAFWVPRDLETLPAFTTNVEWGMWFDSGKVVLGYPTGAAKMRYLAYHAQQEHVSIHHSLDEVLKEAIERLTHSAERSGGEREIPLHIWNLLHFQGWLETQKRAGNRIDGARVLWTFRIGPQKNIVFAFALWVNVYIAAEERNKVNEFIIARPDIATIVGYSRAAALHDVKVVLIREFRSPARTKDGFVREIPGGSSWKPGADPFEVMAEELAEETGLVIADTGRIRRVGTRQLNATLSTHVAHVFAIELTDREIAFLEQQQADNVVHGVAADTERTYVEVHRLQDLLSSNTNAVDWSMLGMILTAFFSKPVA